VARNGRRQFHESATFGSRHPALPSVRSKSVPALQSRPNPPVAVAAQRQGLNSGNTDHSQRLASPPTRRPNRSLVQG